MTDQYAVIGNPIAHSRSPDIHQAFAKQTCQAISYTKLLAPLDGFATTLEAFRRQGGKGVNVTAPFKTEAFHYTTCQSPRARLARAVNTIVFHADGTCFGDNTDGIGLLRDLTQNLQLTLGNKTILMLGAGGAVRGILTELLAVQPQTITLANRTLATAQHLVNELLGQSPILDCCALTDLTPRAYHLIINTLPNQALAEVLANLPASIIDNQTVCYDLNYLPYPTLFQQWAMANHCAKSYSGFGMLIEQAAEAFFIWRGVRPNTKAILNSLTDEE